MKNEKIIERIIVPRVNPNDEFLMLSGWLVPNNAKVNAGTIIAELETSKAAIEVEANSDGYIKYFAKEQDEIAVGDVLAIITSDLSTEIKLSEFKIEDKVVQENNNEKQVTKKAGDLIKKHKIELTDIKTDKAIIKSIDVERYLADAKSDNQSQKENDNPINNTHAKNYINDHANIQYGNNCFISSGVSLSNVILGDQVWINKNATIYGSKGVSFGSGCYVGPNVWIEGHAGIKIGNFVHIAGPGTCLYSHSGMKTALRGVYSGNPGFKSDKETYLFQLPIVIGNNVWIGPNCTIFPGVTLEDNIVVMPNTLVKSGVIKKYSLVHGDGKIEKNSGFVKSLSD